MTAFTTLPFFTWPSGEASFTAAVTISPRPAFFPLAPPRGRIICSLRAPELSATSSMVLICTAIALSPQISSSRLLLGGGRFHLRERGAADNLFQVPALQLTQRTRLTDANHVAHACGVLLVVRIELLVGLHYALVLGVRLAHLHFHHDGLLHLGRNDLADLLVAARLRGGFCCGLYGFTHHLASLLLLRAGLLRLRGGLRRARLSLGLLAVQAQLALTRNRLDARDIFP